MGLIAGIIGCVGIPAAVLGGLILAAVVREKRRAKAEDAGSPVPTWKRLIGPGSRERDVERRERFPQGPDRRAHWGLPKLEEPNDVWRHLGLRDFRQLVHLSDVHSMANFHGPRARAKADNYIRRDIPKRSGGTRRICAPKPLLKRVQRRLLADIFARVPVHAAATAYRPGTDATRNAAAHTRRKVVLCWDLRDFFPSIGRRRVNAMLQWLGYPASVSYVLANLCTTKADPRLYAFPNERSLPQGAPTSPAISNIVCYRMDCRLAGLARRFHATYSRYADDIAFSGDGPFIAGMPKFIPLVERIIRAEGFHIHRKKRRFMRRARPQRVTGLNVNTHASLGRGEYDRLRAVLHNARRAGSLESQNRDGRKNFADHIRGRIAWVERHHPGKGAKLRRAWDELHSRQPAPPAPPPVLPEAPPPE